MSAMFEFSDKAENISVLLWIGLAASEVVEGRCRYLDDVLLNERSALFCTLYLVLYAALPLKDSYNFSWEEFCEECEDLTEINLAVSQRAESSCSLTPLGITTIHPNSAITPEFSILDMKRSNEFSVNPNKFQVVKRLQDKVARVIDEAHSLIVAGCFSETLKAQTVHNIRGRMRFIREGYIIFLREVKNRPPTPDEFFRCLFHQPLWSLRPGIDKGPEKTSRHGRNRLQTEIKRCLNSHLELVLRPFASILVVQALGIESIESHTVLRVAGYDLALKMCRKLGDSEPHRLQLTLQVIAVDLGFGSLLQINNSGIPARYLDKLVAKSSHPLADVLEIVEGCFVP